MIEALLITTEPPGESLDWAMQEYADVSVAVLALDPDAADRPVPDRWQRLPVADLLDTEALRKDFLAFLDAWPRQPLSGGKSFDEMFRRTGGYSVWWTGPGAERHWDGGVFPKLRTLWLFDRALKAHSPRRVLVHTRQADLAWSLASRCRDEDCQFEFLPGSARRTLSPWSGHLWWLGKSLALLLVFPWAMLVHAMLARARMKIPRETAPQRQAPAVVFASPFHWFHFRPDLGEVAPWFWRGLCQALSRVDPGIRQRYLVQFGGNFYGYKRIARVYHTGWKLLGELDGVASPRNRHVACGRWLRSLPSQLASLVRYHRLERTSAFRNSFEFAGADVSCFYVTMLRHSIIRLSAWAHTVGTVVKSLRKVGNVKAMVVGDELYTSALADLAAAREMGIPTIGVQHGTIMPTHLVYTPPPGYVQGAPTPDYFAAYGEYAKETVSVHGAFPAERVWITGGARFDHLVKNPQNPSLARRRLRLPRDNRIVLMTSQCYPWFQEAARAVFEAARDRKDTVVCFKKHPVDVPLDVYRRIAQETRSDKVLFFEGQLEDLLAACDVLISASSTTILEAILLGRRTICVNFSDASDRYPYVADGGSVGARSPQEVRSALDRVFSDDAQPDLEADRRKFLSRHTGPSGQGRAADTLARRIAALCHDRQGLQRRHSRSISNDGSDG